MKETDGKKQEEGHTKRRQGAEESRLGVQVDKKQIDRTKVTVVVRKHTCERMQVFGTSFLSLVRVAAAKGRRRAWN